MIDLCTWPPTPNGQKAQIMLEEVGVPVSRCMPIDIIAVARSSRLVISRCNPEQQGAHDRRP